MAFTVAAAEPDDTPQALGPGIITHIGQGSNTKVVVPDALAARCAREPGSASSDTEADGGQANKTVTSGRTGGYRIQVFSDNNARTAKNEARVRARNIAAQFPTHQTYVVYSSPYWRLRVGNFRTHEEAQQVADEMKAAFPSYAREIRVVRDRIIVSSPTNE